jgi:hypothetical protein
MVVLDRHPGSASRVHSTLTSPAGSNIWSSAATTPSRAALTLVTQIGNEASKCETKDSRPESHHVKPLLLMPTRNSSKCFPWKCPLQKALVRWCQIHSQHPSFFSTGQKVEEGGWRQQSLESSLKLKHQHGSFSSWSNPSMADLM